MIRRPPVFVRGRSINGHYLIGPFRSRSSLAAPFLLLCSCRWQTSVPQGAEHHVLTALNDWRSHAAESPARVAV